MSEKATGAPEERDPDGQDGVQAGDRPGLAAGLMVGSLVLLSLQDALVKFASSDISLWHFQLIRAAINLGFVMLMIVFIWPNVRIVPKRFLPVLFRSALLATTMVFFFAGAPFLSTSQMAAGLYVFPLFVTILSFLFFGEKVGPRRCLAVACGFGGSVLILKPGTDSFQWIAVLPVLAGLCYAGVVLTTRNLCRDEQVQTLVLGVNIGYLSLAAIGLTAMELLQPVELQARHPYLFTGWTDQELWVYGVIVACAALNVTSNMGLTKAYQSAESSWLAPIDYSYLVFATLWGWLLFNHLPDIYSVLGMAMIAGGGMYVAWRERRLKELNAAQLNRALR